MPPPDADPQDLARRCADAMWAGDEASRRLGMELVSVGPGAAELTMTVRPDMVNGHGLCHGGLIAALADSAFAVACNTHGPVTVAAGFEITFVAPARAGDQLIARAGERARFGRSGLYDVTVSRRDAAGPAAAETVVAEFRGRSREVGGS